MPSPSGPALLVCPVEMQAQLSRVLKLAMDRTSSSTLVTTGPVLPTAVGSEERRKGASLPAPHHLRTGEWHDQLSHIHALRAYSRHPPLPVLTMASSTVYPGAAHGLISLNADELFRALQPVRGGASYAQPLDIHWSTGGCPDQGHPHDL